MKTKMPKTKMPKPITTTTATSSSSIDSPNSPYSLLSGDHKNLRVSAGAVARMDGVVVGIYTNGGTHAVTEEFLQQVTKVLALRCAGLSPNQRALHFTETTCSEKINIHFFMDPQARIFLLGVDKAYPTRLALLALEDFARDFAACKAGPRSLVCGDDGCKVGVKEAVCAIARKYEDVSGAEGTAGGKDQVTRIQKNVEGVREQMQVNITKALENLNTTEDILVKSEELNASALVFKKRATKLKQLVWWQKTKYQAMLAGVVVSCVCVLVAVLVLKFK